MYIRLYKASYWDCDDCYIAKTKRRSHDRKTEHFKVLTSNSHSSAITDHMTQTGHRIKWDRFDILATGQSDLIHCEMKETLRSVYFHLLFLCHYLPYLALDFVFKIVVLVTITS